MFFVSTTELALQHFTSSPVNQAHLLGINVIVPSVCILVGGTGHFLNNILQVPTSVSVGGGVLGKFLRFLVNVFKKASVHF